MPCDSGLSRLRAEERAKKEAEREAALRALEGQIARGEVFLSRNARGEVVVHGWDETAAARAGWCDGCALRALQRTATFAVRSTLANAGVTKRNAFVSRGHNHHTH